MCTRGEEGHNGQVAVGEGGPRSHWPWVGRPVGSAGPRVGPLVPPFGLLLPQRLKTLKLWCTAKSLLERMSKLFFPKDLKLRKYFWYFCEKGKLLEKFQHAENEFENFKYAVEKQQMRCKESLKRRRKKI